MSNLNFMYFSSYGQLKIMLIYVEHKKVNNPFPTYVSTLGPRYVLRSEICISFKLVRVCFKGIQRKIE